METMGQVRDLGADKCDGGPEKQQSPVTEPAHDHRDADGGGRNDVCENGSADIVDPPPQKKSKHHHESEACEPAADVAGGCSSNQQAKEHQQTMETTTLARTHQREQNEEQTTEDRHSFDRIREEKECLVREQAKLLRETERSPHVNDYWVVRINSLLRSPCALRLSARGSCSPSPYN
jgi:acyl-coenzyme A thioesterase PaaI-like protein